jgi:hypothetical protein
MPAATPHRVVIIIKESTMGENVEKIGTGVAKATGLLRQWARELYRQQSRSGKILVWYGIVVTLLLVLSLFRHRDARAAVASPVQAIPAPIVAVTPTEQTSLASGEPSMSPDAAAAMAQYGTLNGSLLMYEIDQQMRPDMDDIQKELWKNCKEKVVEENDAAARIIFGQLMSRPFYIRDVTKQKWINDRALTVLFARSLGGDTDRKLTVDPPADLKFTR